VARPVETAKGTTGNDGVMTQRKRDTQKHTSKCIPECDVRPPIVIRVRVNLVSRSHPGGHMLWEVRRQPLT
jgi:hypothetical protein